MENLKLEKLKLENERKVKFSEIFKNGNGKIFLNALLMPIFTNPMLRDLVLMKMWRNQCNDKNWLKENFEKMKREVLLNNLKEFNFSRGNLLNWEVEYMIGYYDLYWMNMVTDMYDELFGTFEWAH